MHFLLFKKQQNALTKVQWNWSQNTLHIRCQVIHVSAPQCQHHPWW